MNENVWLVKNDFHPLWIGHEIWAQVTTIELHTIYGLQFGFKSLILFDRVLVKRNDEPAQTSGGLFLPETANKEKPAEGTILAVGNGRVSDDGTVTPLIVKTGQIIVFGKYAGTEIKIDGEDRLILREDDILGVIEN